MSQVSYGTITITDTNDIESIVIEYNKNQDNQNPPSEGDSNWSTNRPTWQQGYYIWQRTRIHKSGTATTADIIGTPVCVTGSTGEQGQPGTAGRSLTGVETEYCIYGTGTPSDSYSGWQDTIPEYNSSTPNYWVKVTNTYSSAPTTEVVKYKDTGITNAMAKAADAQSRAATAETNASNALSLSQATQQHFWFVPENTGSGASLIEAGAYITDTAIDTFKSGKNGGYLLARSDGLELGHGTNKFMTLSATALNFYRPGTNTIDATLTSKGLVLSKGGIEAGTKNTTNYIYIYSDDDATNHKLTINSHEASDWRIVAGKNFGVDKAGNLYASGADIQGKITVTSESNVYTTDEVNPLEIGGRNLLLNTAQERVSPASASGSAYIQPSLYLSDYGKSVLNNTTDEWTYSFDYEVTGNSATNAYVYAQIKGSAATESLYISGHEVGHFTKTFTLTETQVSSTTETCNIRLRNATDGAVLTVRNAKLEKGNKATDWTPAPEDMATITQMNSAIEEKADEINLSVESKTYQAGQPNLSPWFSHTPYEVNDYWKTAFNSLFTYTDMGDGWVRVQCTNTTSSVVRSDPRPIRSESVKPNSDYTFLYEIRNNHSTCSNSVSNIYVVQNNDSQFWGGDCKKNLEGARSDTYVIIKDLPQDSSKSYIKRFIKTSEPIGSSHWSVEKPTGLCAIVQRCEAGDTIDYELRISIYEGEYTGPYKPYVGSQQQASTAELKIQADRIGMVVANNDASSTLELTANAMSYIGDHVEIKDSTGSATVIKGGKLYTNEITVGSLKDGEDYYNKDNLEIGGTNLLSDYAWGREANTYTAQGITVSRLDIGLYEATGTTTATGDIWWGTSRSASGGFGDEGNYVYSIYIESGTWPTSGIVLQIAEADGTTWSRNIRSEPGETSVAFTIASGHHPYHIGFYSSAAEVDLNITFRVKLEKGNKATDWSPASEEIMNNNVKVGGTNLLGSTDNPTTPTQANSSASSTFGTIGRYNSPMSEFSLEDYDEVSNAIVITSSVTGNRGVGWYTHQGDIVAGETYTFSCRVKSSVAVTVHTHTAWRNGSATTGYTGWTSGGSVSLMENVWTDYSYTFTPSSNANLDWEFMVALCFTGQTTGVICHIAHAKFEKGNKATDWEPAPAELAATATSYITKINEEGITIHPEDPMSRNYLQINSDGISINTIKGTIAQYGESIRLGDSSTYLEITSNIVEFFDNKKSMAKFGYDEIFESYGVQGENIFIKGAGNALRLDNNVNGTYQGQYILETRANGHLSLKPGLRRTEEV